MASTTQPLASGMKPSESKIETTNANVYIDTNILRCLPEGTSFKEVIPWGASGWTQTTLVRAELADGTEVEYFLKTCSAKYAAVMMKGEFYSLREMHIHIPESCPEPFGWGECQTSPGTFFLIIDFLHLIAEHPEPKTITQLVSELHKRSAGQSPDGKFGFHVPNCHGKIVQPNTWDTDWCRYFTNLITLFFECDIAFNGPDPDYERAYSRLKQHTIPRLLEPLQANGRMLQPCLIHGDLWQENIGTNEETDGPMVYDPSAFYAHNEYELGMWRTITVPFDESYRKQYRMRFPPTEPAEEWDDRNRLYSLAYNISHSAHWHGAVVNTRPRIMDDMQYLNNKYASHIPVGDILEKSTASGEVPVRNDDKGVSIGEYVELA